MITGIGFLNSNIIQYCGGSGIQTPDTLSGMPLFKSGAFNHSAKPPFNLAPSLGRVPLKVLLPTIHAWTGILSLVGGILLRFSSEPRYGLEPQTC